VLCRYGDFFDVENQPKSSPTPKSGERAPANGASAIRLSGFSLEVLDGAAPSEDWSVEETVERAVRMYLGARKLRPPGWACLPLPEGDRDRPGVAAIDVPVDGSTLTEISSEAEAQGVSLEAVVTHAVMYLWASEHPPVVGSRDGDEQEAAEGQSARRGATTGVAPSFARDPRRLSRPR
jgi:hypothetical protein